MIKAKESLQHVHNEFHWRVIVIQKHDLIQRRALRFLARFKDDARIAVAATLIITRHMDRTRRQMVYSAI